MTSPIILVTGASRGIGYGCARYFASLGWTPILFARSPETVALAAELGGAGFCGSLTNRGDLERLIEFAYGRYGRIDGALLSTGDPPTNIPAADIDDEAWVDNFELLFLSVVRLSRLLASRMKQHKRGSIVAIAAADLHEPGDFSPFSVLRLSMAGYGKLFARQHARHDIRFNTLSPSYAWDDESEASGYPTDQYGAIGRAATYAEIGRAAAFLLSDDASYVTGTDLRIDGAWSRAI